MYEGWPLAYADKNSSEPLLDHLVRTACLACCLFGYRAKVLLLRWRRRWDPDQALWMLGFFHDIGKASNTYRSTGFSGGKLSFPLHEYISALLVYRCGDIVLKHDEGLGDLIKVLAKSIARHHAAMVDRDPTTVMNSMRPLENRVREVLRGLEESMLRSLLEEGLKRSPYSDLVAVIEPAMLEALEDLKEQSSLHQALLKLRASSEDLWIITGLTGFLVLADNIVANASRRSSVDGFTPLYILTWKRELKEGLQRCSTCLQGPFKSSTAEL